MNNTKYIEMVNKKIDGLITAEEELWLAAHLQKNAGDKEFLTDLEKSMDMLNNLEKVNPPARLKQNILNNIDHGLYAPKASVGRKNLWFSFNYPSHKISLAFASGLLIGILMFSLYKAEDVYYGKDIYGSIGLQDMGNLNTINESTINSMEVSGLFTASHSADVLLLDVNLQSYSDVLFSIEYDPEVLVFSGFKNLERSDSHLDNNPGLLKLTMNGVNKSQLLFRKLSGLDSDITILLSTDQQTVLNKKMVVESL